MIIVRHQFPDTTEPKTPWGLQLVCVDQQSLINLEVDCELYEKERDYWRDLVQDMARRARASECLAAERGTRLDAQASIIEDLKNAGNMADIAAKRQAVAIDSLKAANDKLAASLIEVTEKKVQLAKSRDEYAEEVQRLRDEYEPGPPAAQCDNNAPIPTLEEAIVPYTEIAYPVDEVSADGWGAKVYPDEIAPPEALDYTKPSKKR